MIGYIVLYILIGITCAILGHSFIMDDFDKSLKDYNFALGAILLVWPVMFGAFAIYAFFSVFGIIIRWTVKKARSFK